jgi:hypothetical protein
MFKLGPFRQRTFGFSKILDSLDLRTVGRELRRSDAVIGEVREEGPDLKLFASQIFFFHRETPQD